MKSNKAYQNLYMSVALAKIDNFKIQYKKRFPYNKGTFVPEMSYKRKWLAADEIHKNATEKCLTKAGADVSKQ